jgi:DNA-binding transcriptional MerR regulator
LTVKAIRFYEAKGLLPEVARVGSYRDYSAVDIDRLKLVAHCRSLGFTVEEIHAVIQLVTSAAPACPDPLEMSQLIDAKLQDVKAQIALLQERAAGLEQVARYVAARRPTA